MNVGGSRSVALRLAFLLEEKPGSRWTLPSASRPFSSIAVSWDSDFVLSFSLWLSIPILLKRRSMFWQASSSSEYVL